MWDSENEHRDHRNKAASNCHWLPWIQRQLILKDILAQTPEMPVPYAPDYEAWKKVFEYFPLDENTTLIGHSCGAGFIVRYLSEHTVKVGKVVLVAPWIDPTHSLPSKMFEFHIDENLVSKTKAVTIFSSTNDMAEVQESVRILAENVKDIQIREFPNMGHFCFEDMHTEEFPELLEEALS
jgi:predicted alpha/beta hydrolase family esterase